MKVGGRQSTGGGFSGRNGRLKYAWRFPSSGRSRHLSRPLLGGMLAVEAAMFFLLLAGCAPTERIEDASDVRPTFAGVAYGF